MDSFKDPISIRNPSRVNNETDKPKTFKNSPKHTGTNDNVESVFTSTSNLLDDNMHAQNGPGHKQNNSDVNESPHSSKKSNENSECNKNVRPLCSIVNNSIYDLPAGPSASASASRSELNDFDHNKDQKQKVSLDRITNNAGPSTSGINNIHDTVENNSFRENRKRPSTLKLNRPPVDADDSSSDTGNDDYSLGSEDGCIYTYRGGEHLADLPSSFFSLDMGLSIDRQLPHANYQVPQQGAQNARENNSRASSPDMEFLEMDFDPGPSCEADSGDESSPDVDLDDPVIIPEQNEQVIRGTSPEYLAAVRYNPLACVPTTSNNHAETSNLHMPLTSTAMLQTCGDMKKEPENNTLYGPLITHTNMRGENLLVRRTMSHWPHTATANLHVTSGDLVSPREIINYEEDSTDEPFAHQINQGERPTFDTNISSSALYHINMAKKLVEETKSETDQQSCSAAGEPSTSTSDDARCSLPPRCMVWSEREACERQITQIGTSACGATAVVNVFIALSIPVNVEQINASVGTRLRANNAPLPRYLLSRAVAGCTAADLVTGIQRASEGLVTARFFPTYPERAVSLSHWLADWISLGAVPILTLNLQVACDGEIPDAWHHQMVFGVSHKGVYLCNPVECVPESILWPRLTSPSVLLVRTRDVLTRFTANTDLTPLMMVPDRRFHTFNVLGQVANAIREWSSAGWSEHGTRTRHIRIPAAYQAGVTVAALTGSEAHRRLMHAAQLPIIGPQFDR